MSEIEPAGTSGKVRKKTVDKTPSGRALSRSTMTGRFITKAAAARNSSSSNVAGARHTSRSPEKDYPGNVEVRVYDKPRRKRSRAENEKLIAAAKALVVDLRKDRDSLPHGI